MLEVLLLLRACVHAFAVNLTECIRQPSEQEHIRSLFCASVLSTFVIVCKVLNVRACVCVCTFLCTVLMRFRTVYFINRIIHYVIMHSGIITFSFPFYFFLSFYIPYIYILLIFMLFFSANIVE